MTDPDELFKRRLKAAILAKYGKVADFEEAVDLRRGAIAQWFHSTKLPAPQFIGKACRMLHVSPNWLFGFGFEPSKGSRLVGKYYWYWHPSGLWTPESEVFQSRSGFFDTFEEALEDLELALGPRVEHRYRGSIGAEDFSFQVDVRTRGTEGIVWADSEFVIEEVGVHSGNRAESNRWPEEGLIG